MLLAGIATALPDGISEVLDEHKIGGLLVFGSKRNPPGSGIALGIVGVSDWDFAHAPVERARVRPMAARLSTFRKSG